MQESQPEKARKVELLGMWCKDMSLLLFEPLEVRESQSEKTRKVELLGVLCNDMAFLLF